MLFRGYLPLMSAWIMAQLLNILELTGSDFKPFPVRNSKRVMEHAVATVKRQNWRSLST